MIKALAFVLLALSSITHAATPPTSATPTRFRCAPTTAGVSNNAHANAVQIDSATLHSLALTTLHYQCFTSTTGDAVLIGQTGEQHEQTVFLIHGLGNAGHHDWRETIPVLAHHYHVVTVDLPGFGGSSPSPRGYAFATLRQLLQQINELYSVGPAIVVGHSLGGAIALDYTHHHPELVERLVLVDTAGILQKQVFANHMTQPALPQLGLPPVDRVLGSVSRRIDTVKRSVLNWPDRVFDFTKWLQENPTLRALILRDQVMMDAAVGLVETDFSAAIRETQTPAVLLWGSEDQIAPLRTGLLLANRMPNARLYIVPGARHVPMREAPTEFHRLLTDTLRLPMFPPLRVAKTAMSSATASDIQCRHQNGVRYTGAIGTLSLDNCQDVKIDSAQIRQLKLNQSSVQLFNVEVNSDGVALHALNSQVLATATRLAGTTAVQADNSRFDLAGTSLIGLKHAVQVDTASMFYFSVSEWQSGNERRDRHEVIELMTGSY